MVGQVPLPAGAAPLELLRETGVASDDRLLTIVIGSYNHCRYLPEAFAAIEASQACDRLAVIFIDDGSPDGTMDFVASYPFDPALHVRIYAKRNAGLRDSLASGLALTDTRFVAFIASDDYYEPQGLAAVVARLEVQGNDDLCWICQATYLEGRDGELVYGDATAAMIDAAPEPRERALSVEFPKPLLLQSSVFGTAMLRDTRAWQDKLMLDDWPTFVKVSRLARHRPVDMRTMFEIVLCRYRVHDSGTHNNLRRQLAICMEVATQGVAPEYRREAVANVLADVALIHLYQRELPQAAKLFGQALIKNPVPGTITRPLGRVFSSITRRIGRDGSR
ncbi:glycosyltransferase family 2 protein [Sphingomonas sp. IC4-52]|uniref:glycosyltransferase family 2 protein n=1 Tax=Sphingomonas sp. IC4-52 TaxID=2887202 RepID=UPI001D126EFF|nr:glycosyltransferase family A protein [Sphingomonas sp. IC4-52]MCC2981666.1 glycosyltransferase family 2 protein [Sphingomonas sp. IC4-52]